MSQRPPDLARCFDPFVIAMLPVSASSEMAARGDSLVHDRIVSVWVTETAIRVHILFVGQLDIEARHATEALSHDRVDGEIFGM